MRIGIDAFALTRPTITGIGYYNHNLIKNILEIDSENEYYLYTNTYRKIDFAYPNLRISQHSTANPINRFSTTWMLFNARRQLAEDKIDVFWGTQGIIPPSIHKFMKTVLTVCDLTYYFFPHTMALDSYLVSKFFFGKSITNANKIIAISYTTKHDLEKVLKGNIKDDKISVIYPGLDNNKFKIFDKNIAKKNASESFNISEKYLLFVGTVEPRKNIIGLLKAFKILKERYNIKHQLILVGATGWKNSELFKIYERLSFKDSEVKFLGYVKENELPGLYCGADLFILPSFYEGFGMPLVEAMACGVPVVASDIPVFKEISEGSALLMDPNDPREIAKGIYEVLSNDSLKAGLINRGLNRTKFFSWRKAAEEALEVFRTVCHERI